MSEITRVDATLHFEYKGNFEGDKVNWGHIFIFLMIWTLYEQLFTKQ